MGYLTYSFLWLVAAGLLLCRVLPKICRRYILLTMSTVFVWQVGGALSLIFLGLQILVSFWGGRQLSRLGEDIRRKRLLLCFLLLFHLLILCHFKYYDFWNYTLEALYMLCGRVYVFTPTERAAPLGISFYTLILIGYLIDVYQRKTAPERSLSVFSLFSGYFGHILQGPIDSYTETGRQFSGNFCITRQKILDGIQLILFGLLQKLVISERLAMIVDPVYADYAGSSAQMLVLAAAAFSLQLYTDFCGCIDIARGVSLLFGIQLSENFRRPFFAESIAEFWRRWHISLGAFFRKYVYIPLGGNRKGTVRKYWNMSAVFFLSGLWHGGNWTFVIGTGLLHCFYMIVGTLLSPAFEALYRVTGFRKDSLLFRWLRRLRTFILVSIGFILFRSDSLAMAGSILSGIVSGRQAEAGAAGWAFEITPADVCVLFMGLGILFFHSLYKEWKDRAVCLKECKEKAEADLNACEEKNRTCQRDERQITVCLILLAVVLIFGCYGRGYDASAFIYSKF